MRRTLLSALLMLGLLTILAACETTAPPPGQPSPVAVTPATPGAAPAPVVSPTSVTTAATPVSVAAVERGAGEIPVTSPSWPTLPLPFLPVDAGQPVFLAAGDFFEAGAPALLLLRGDYTAETTAWLWPVVAAAPAAPIVLSLGGTGIPYPAAGDFNEDGLADLAYLGDSAVQLRLSSANGPLSEPVTVQRAGQHGGLAAGDFNGDGHLDVAAAFSPDYATRQIELLLGDGKGSLTASGVTLAVQGGNAPHLAADFNADQVDDLATWDAASSSVVVYFGGEQPFADSAVLPIDATLSDMAAGDFDMDGWDDLLLLPYSGLGVEPVAAQLWYSTGALGNLFDRQQTLQAPSNVARVQPADYNGDGWLDLLFTPGYSAGPSVLLLRNIDQQDGANPGWDEVSLPVAARDGLAAAADFDGNGHHDIAAFTAIGPATQGVALLAGSPNGWQSPTRLTGPDDVWAVAAADFDGDGQEDFAVARSQAPPDRAVLPVGQAGTVDLYLGQGEEGGYKLSASQPVGFSPQALLATDVNDDGAIDLLSADFGSTQVSVLLGDGQGGLLAADPLPAGLNPQALAAGDLNDDGAADLVVANGASGDVGVYLGQGQGNFAAAASLFVGKNPWALALADFDDNGRLDLAVAQANFAGSDQVGSVLLYPGQGDGTFAAPLELATGPNPTDLAAADFDGDDRVDLAVAFSAALADFASASSAQHAARGVATLLNQGNSVFQKAWESGPVVAYPHHLLAADIDGDGVVDLAAGGANGASPWLGYHVLNLLKGHGDGTFEPPAVFGAGGAVRDLAALDANADGRLDLVLAQPGQGAQLYVNNPSQAPAVAAAAAQPPPPWPSAPSAPAPNPPPSGEPSPVRPLVATGGGQIALPTADRIVKLVQHPQAGLLYALDSAGTIHVVDDLTLQEQTAWPLNALDVLLDPAGQQLFVSRLKENDTVILDPLTGEQQTALPRSGALVLDTLRNRLYLIGPGVSLVDLESGRLLGSLPAAWSLYTSYVYSAGNLSGLYDPVNDRLVVRGTLGGPGSSGSVQDARVYDGETLRRLPTNYGRSYWLPDMAVDAATGELYATASSMDSVVHSLSFFGADGKITGEISGIGGRILQPQDSPLLYLLSRGRLVTVDLTTRSVAAFMPLPNQPTAAVIDPATERIVMALPDGRLLAFSPADQQIAQPPVGPPQSTLPANRPVLELDAQGDLLTARLAGPPETYGQPRELYRSTDRGQTWQRIGEDFMGVSIDQVVLDPAGAGRLWGVAAHSGQPAGVVRAEQAGETWQLADIGLRHLRLTDLQTAAGAPDTLFALARSDRRLYRSSDGSTWQQVHGDASTFLLSPRFGQDRTIWLRTTSDTPGRFAVSTDGGDTWQYSAESPWWREFEDATFYFSPGWPNSGAAYRVERDTAWMKPAGGSLGGAWQPLTLPKAKGSSFERLEFQFVDDSRFLAFYSDPESEGTPGALYWTEDGGARWRLLLDGASLGKRLTAIAAQPDRLAQEGQFWLGTSAGQVQQMRLADLLNSPTTPQPTPTPTASPVRPTPRPPTPQPPTPTPTAAPQPTPTPTPGPKASDAPPPGLTRPDSRLASAWEQVSGQMGWARSSARAMPAAMQPFQSGLMLWLSQAVPGSATIAGPTILAMANDGRWQAQPDAWSEDQPASDPTLAPPPGLIQPVRGFGKVWRETQGVRERLGWGLSTEQGGETFVQAFEHGLMIQVGGKTYALIDRPGENQWRAF